MCGILYTSSEYTREKFLSSLQAMLHRGPSAPLCYFEYKQYKMGHNRLSIIDLDNRSNQPFISDDERYVIIYNGEIYNYKELAKQFGIHMLTNSDTELLLKLYIQYGPKMLNWLNGMFSFVIFDIKTEKLFVARDRMGVKPLYYYRSGNNFTISSEIDPLLQLIGRYTIDEIAVRQYKKMRSFYNNRTIYNEIKEFPPGHYLENGYFIKYWEIDYSDKEPPSDEELMFLIQSAVNYRKIADVNVGSYLSGGLDSTIITALSGVADTWTVGFENYNEFEWSELASKKYGTNHNPIIFDEKEYLLLSRKLIHAKKEPLSVPNEVLLYYMTKIASEKNTVILSGEGADELFYGYDRIFRWANNAEDWDLKSFTDLYAYGSDNDLEIVHDAVQPFMKHKLPLKIVASFFQEAHLRGLLKRLDSASMLNSVEARSPFLDYRLIEKLAGVSIEYKMKNGVVKEPLKRLYKYTVPIEIINRKKIGFPVPLDKVFAGVSIEGESFFDKWFNFNLRVLGEVL
ncbi:asparagine synthase (glutamine-hydrolyzing) [Paenibacillus lactis]|uniref:asparagine synthase (glutamine-hydrolyzing) n=1 Tax=Paenibacillus lactis TaxID=228574 RepID=UPI001B23EA20|nr:asparagine synthase (glutamine-hydrolyzing) [Paenibacillus lactis]GIO92513.1 asparagine synthetase B [Paenibacillus lactis]